MLDATIAAYPAAEQPPGSWWVPERLGGSAPSLAGRSAGHGREAGARGETGGEARQQKGLVAKSFDRLVALSTYRLLA